MQSERAVLTKDLGGGSWVSYDPDWLSSFEADEALGALLGELEWEQREIIAKGKTVLQPRLMAWAGSLPYLYSGQVLEPRAMHPIIASLGQRLSQELEVELNHVVINHYRDGRDRVGFHADDEPELGYEPVIASVSLGASRNFVMRSKYKRRKWSKRLRHGSLLVMGGRCQHRWYHGVPSEPSVTAPRLNLTYRHLRGAPGWRAPREEDPRQRQRQ
jgi:alkylated DNA repair dioxygenase AlkB